MTSTLYLYKDCKIIPSKNFVVDSIDDYLSGLTKITILDYQYLRNDLNLFIKIDKSQVYTDSTNTYNYNYLKVVQNRVSYYYFILKKTQISQSTIGLELLMDTLNTYKWNVDFTISSRSRVLREHKDRIKVLFPRELRFNINSSNVSYMDSGTTPNTYYDGAYLRYQIGSGTPSWISGARFQIYHTDTPLRNILYLSFSSNNSRKSFMALRDRENVSILGLYHTSGDSSPYFEFNNVSPRDLLPFNSLGKLRIVDYFPEDINPVLYKEKNASSEVSNMLDNEEGTTWNLIYRSDENDNDAIQCFCLPSIDLKAKQVSSGTLVNTDFVSGTHYFFIPFTINSERQNITLTDNDGESKECKFLGASIGNEFFQIIDVYLDGADLKIRNIKGTRFTTGAYPNDILITDTFPWKTITSLSFEKEYIYYKTQADMSSGRIINALTYSAYFSTTATLQIMDSIRSVDRVDPKLIKIIEIPYFPSPYTFDKDDLAISTDSTWAYSSDVYRGFALNELNNSFSCLINSHKNSPFNNLELDITTPNPNEDLRTDENESKMFNSEFYQPKFVYDSFGFIFQLEKMDEDYWYYNSEYLEDFSFEFVMTSTINSKFLFRFPSYVLKMSTEDFDNILPIARNNEAPIYNSNYITYLRTAYRYDLKSIELNRISKAFSFATGLGQTTIGITQSVVDKEYGSAINKFLGYMNSTTALATSVAKDWNSLQAKMDSLKNQATGVSGSDDLDLLNAYSMNKAWLNIYSPNERIKKLLLDQFYYYGYSTDEIKIPSINTRYWFNFLACKLEFTGITDNISEMSKDNLVQRFSIGATFLHVHTINSVKTWDFEQVRENWEMSLANEFNY